MWASWLQPMHLSVGAPTHVQASALAWPSHSCMQVLESGLVFQERCASCMDFVFPCKAARTCGRRLGSHAFSSAMIPPQLQTSSAQLASPIPDPSPIPALRSTHTTHPPAAKTRIPFVCSNVPPAFVLRWEPPHSPPHHIPAHASWGPRLRGSHRRRHSPAVTIPSPCLSDTPHRLFVLEALLPIGGFNCAQCGRGRMDGLPTCLADQARCVAFDSLGPPFLGINGYAAVVCSSLRPRLGALLPAIAHCTGHSAATPPAHECSTLLRPCVLFSGFFVQFSTKQTLLLSYS